MEELADAIEDAQYVNAISSKDDGPRPVLKWDKPTNEELTTWENKVMTQYRKDCEEAKTASTSIQPPQPTPFTMEWVCQQEIGYFLFSQYIKEIGKDYVRMNFSEDVWRFTQIQSKPARLIAAVQIARLYLGLDQIPKLKRMTTNSTPTTITTSEAEEEDGSSQPQQQLHVVPEEKPKSSLSSRSGMKLSQRSIVSGVSSQPGSEEITAAVVTIGSMIKSTSSSTKKINSSNDDEASGSIMNNSDNHPFHYVWPEPPKTEIVEYTLARRIVVDVGTATTTTTSSSSTPVNNKIMDRTSSGELRSSMDSHLAVLRQQQQSTATTTSSSSAAIATSSPTATVLSTVHGMTEQEIRAMLLHNFDYPICSESIIGVRGPILKEIISIIQDVAAALIAQSNNRTNNNPSSTTAVSTTSESAEVDVQQEQLDLNRSQSSEDDGQAKHESPSSNQSSPKQESDADVESKTQDIGGKQQPSKATTPKGAETPKTPSLKKGRSRSVITKGTGQETMVLAPPLSPTRASASSSWNHEHYIPTNLFEKAEYLTMESLRRQYWDAFVQSSHYRKLKHFLWYQDRRVQPDDFFVMRVLGRGGFGLVTACRKGTTGKLYAMKVMNKRRIKMKRSEQLALSERMALAAVESKFVINLKYAFHSKDDVFLILDLMTGGDLGYHLHQRRRFSKKECLYFAARILLGLQALHDNGYVYRDLKPENCLLADDGRVKITDLGLATKITPTLHGAAGTRGYWAPEMLRRDSNGKRMTYGHAVDWFSFGCCVAEFISGWNPFRSEAALNFGTERGMTSKEKMIDCATLEMTPEFSPERFEPDAADLCRRLLDKNECTRLGYNGCEEIMAHPWFKSLNWESIISDKKKPPFIPAKDVNAASQSEIGNFTVDKTYQQTVFTAEDEELYQDWDWTNRRAFAAEVIEFWIYERVTGEPLVPIPQNPTCCCTIS